MKIQTVLVGMIAVAVAGAVVAQTTPTSASARARASATPMPKPCLAGSDCHAYTHLLSFPANSLSYAPAASFALQARGVGWLTKPGTMTLTIHRPKDVPVGGNIKISVFHQVTNDAEGTIKFSIEPLAFSSGNSFETYGAQATNGINAPENPTIMQQQSLVLSPGNGWNPDHDWWYLEFTRQGTYNGSLRMMSVAIEY